MAKLILGTKMNMTRFFSAEGKAFPATIVVAGPATVTEVRAKDKNGYSAIQLGFGTIRESLVSKPIKGMLKDKGLFRYLREFRTSEKEATEFALGKTITVAEFTPGDKIAVIATSKAKGFQGVVKRHGFAGGPRTHGQKHSEREAGSIGGGPGRAGGRVSKGIRMAGRMGGDIITVKNLKVLAVDPETNQMLIAGAIPGRRGTLVKIIA